ncbi:MAG: response regulator transcription factor [Actinobacteria bacterium]|nr:response regulator transcription factor [Actinomycetota bacterium]
MDRSPSPALPPLPPLLYAEDDAEIAEMTVEVLSEFYAVDHVADGGEALERALRRGYAVILLDRRLPSKDGVEVVRAIRTARIATPVLLLTALGAVNDRVEGLDAGANDYLVKPFAFEELLARLRALQRAFAADGRRREIGAWGLAPDSQVLYSPEGLRIALTETETALLEVLAASPEHIFTREELLNAVFVGDRSAASVGAGSVDTYVHYVRRKSVPEIIETVRGRGYRLGVPE